MVYSLFLSDIAGPFSLKGEVAEIVNVIAYILVVSVAILVIARTAMRWGRTIRLRSVLNEGHIRRPMFLIWILLIFIASGIVDIFWPGYAQVILYANLIPITFVMYHFQKTVFPGTLPMEAVLATLAISISTLLSLAIAILEIPGKDEIISTIWTFTLIVWSFASLYALYHAPDELGVVNDR